jgi:anhydro-N-acetylmuramic acid kinase
MGQLDRELGRLFADACLALLDGDDTRPSAVRAIGSHGQTIRHHPPSAATAASNAFTLQVADPNTIAECTGIATVADFRRRDIAGGGQGAPLAPAFHAAAFAAPDQNRAIVNIGGIANATLLQGRKLLQGFDTGPGNTLMDVWIGRHMGESCDRGGQWAGAGAVDETLLSELLQHDYFALSGPRSTGKEAFNMAWLDQQLGERQIAPVDVQATLAELTAASISDAVSASGLQVDAMYICGGGVHNDDLLQRLQRRMAPAPVNSTSALGLDPDWVEAVTFAWLAYRTLEGLAGNAPVVTGAGGERVLGGVYSA